MSKKSERFERLDQACEELYEQLGDKFRVKDLASKARVSNTVAGPHKEYWLYRRDQHSLVSDLRARAEAPPKSEVAALCEVASGANANVLALIDTVNKLVAVIGNGRGNSRFGEQGGTAVKGGHPGPTANTPRSGTRTSPRQSFAEADEDENSPTDVKVEDVIASASADPGHQLVENGPIENDEITLVPAMDGKASSTMEGHLPPIVKAHAVELPVLGSQSPLLGLLDQEVSLRQPANPTIAVNTQIDFEFGSTEVLSPSATHGNNVGASSTVLVEDIPQATDEDDGGSSDVQSFAFAEAVAEAVLLKAKCALSASEIYASEIHGGLPPRVRRLYSEQYFSTLLRGSQKLHYNRRDGKFCAKLRGVGVPASKGVPLHLAATRAAAKILIDVEGSLRSEAIHAKLPHDLQTKISEGALQWMLVSGALEDPAIEMTKTGEWYPAGRAASPERRRDTRELFPQFEAEVIRILQERNHPMAASEIHELLAAELKYDFPQDKMYRHLQKVRGIFQFNDKDSTHLDKKWWLKTKKRQRYEAPALDSDKSDRAAAMAYQKRVTEEAESVIVANQPQEMHVDRILIEVRRKFEVGDATKFARALNSRQKAARARIKRVREGVYRARRADEY
jgi:hypothetical protein